MDSEELLKVNAIAGIGVLMQEFVSLRLLEAAWPGQEKTISKICDHLIYSHHTGSIQTRSAEPVGANEFSYFSFFKQQVMA
jgi:hypothetical protein